jgi:hypothetical protein
MQNVFFLIAAYIKTIYTNALTPDLINIGTSFVKDLVLIPLMIIYAITDSSEEYY